MTNLLNPDFWSNQIAGALKAWAILIPLILIVWATFKIKLAKSKKEMRGLRAYTEAAESRLQLARELNAGEANTLDGIRAQVNELRASIKSNAEPSAVEPMIKKIDASAVTLAMTNSTADHVLTAKELAISDLEEKQKLRTRSAT